MATSDHLANKRAVLAALNTIAESRTADVGDALGRIYHPDAEWRGAHPFNEMRGVEAITRQFWQPLLHAFPDLERRDNILIGGQYEGRDYVAAVGHYCGSFQRDWIGLPANGLTMHLRYGEVHQVVEGRIVQSTVLIDVLDAIRQAGFWPLPPSLGAEGMWPGPMGNDGVVLTETDPAESAASLQLMRDMQMSLGAHDDSLGRGRAGLLAMPQVQYWHPKMMWYGPSGIGSTRGLEGFVDGHQLPFRTAFPNRPSVPRSPDRGKDGKNHYIRIGDGAYSATGGWPSRYLDHVGGGWLGQAPTGRAITMRVMDFYKADGGLIRENWVPIDILHTLLQMDVDVLARVRRQFGQRRGA